MRIGVGICEREGEGAEGVGVRVWILEREGREREGLGGK